MRTSTFLAIILAALMIHGCGSDEKQGPEATSNRGADIIEREMSIESTDNESHKGAQEPTFAQWSQNGSAIVSKDTTSKLMTIELNNSKNEDCIVVISPYALIGSQGIEIDALTVELKKGDSDTIPLTIPPALKTSSKQNNHNTMIHVQIQALCGHSLYEYMLEPRFLMYSDEKKSILEVLDGHELIQKHPDEVLVDEWTQVDRDQNVINLEDGLESELLNSLETSRETWNQLKEKAEGTYVYARDSNSMRTEYTIISDEIVARTKYHITDGDKQKKAVWMENRNSIGENRDGLPILFIEDIYNICKHKILTKTDDEVIKLELHENGILKSCYTCDPEGDRSTQVVDIGQVNFFLTDFTDVLDNISTDDPEGKEKTTSYTLRCWHASGDADGDKYAAPNTPSRLFSLPKSKRLTCPSGWVAGSGDCNDSRASQHPHRLEIPKNGLDDNCNGMVDESEYIYSSSGYSNTNSSYGMLIKINNPWIEGLSSYGCRIYVKIKIINSQVQQSILLIINKYYLCHIITQVLGVLWVFM